MYNEDKTKKEKDSRDTATIASTVRTSMMARDAVPEPNVIDRTEKN